MTPDGALLFRQALQLYAFAANSFYVGFNNDFRADRAAEYRHKCEVCMQRAEQIKDEGFEGRV